MARSFSGMKPPNASTDMRLLKCLDASVSVLIPPDRPEELSYLLGRVRAGETVGNFLTKRLRKDGTTVDVEITVSPVVSSDGVVLGGSTIAHDLTRYNRQIADLREAHRSADEAISMLDTLEASAPVGFGFADTQCRLTHLNEMLASFAGSTTDELLGKTVADVVPEIWAQVESIFRRVLEYGEAVRNIEVTGDVPTDPGHRHHWLASYYPVRLETEIIGVGIVAIDVTERRQAEEFRTIAMNQIAEGLFTVDAQGCLTSLNQSGAKLLGWTEEELLGKEMRSFVLADDQDDPSIDEGNEKLLAVRAEGRHVVSGRSCVSLQERLTSPSSYICLTPLHRREPRRCGGCLSRHFWRENGTPSGVTRVGSSYVGGTNSRSPGRGQTRLVFAADCSLSRGSTLRGAAAPHDRTKR